VKKVYRPEFRIELRLEKIGRVGMLHVGVGVCLSI